MQVKKDDLKELQRVKEKLQKEEKTSNQKPILTQESKTESAKKRIYKTKTNKFYYYPSNEWRTFKNIPIPGQKNVELTDEQKIENDVRTKGMRHPSFTKNLKRIILSLACVPDKQLIHIKNFKAEYRDTV